MIFEALIGSYIRWISSFYNSIDVLQLLGKLQPFAVENPAPPQIDRLRWGWWSIPEQPEAHSLVFFPTSV